MEIFVTGGTGYIGRNIIRRLLMGGHAVIALARSEESAAKLRLMGATALIGDLRDTQLVQKALRESDGGVIHAGFGHDDWKNIAESFAVDQNAVAGMLDALAGTNRPFIYTSGSGVFGDTGNILVSESAHADAPYPVTLRIETENLVIKASATRGVRASVIRPGLVYGRGGGAMMQLLLSMARRADGPMTVGDGDNVWSAVHIDDLADLYSLVLGSASPGELYHATNRESFTFRDIATAQRKSSGNAMVPIKKMPLEEARKNLGLLADGLAANKRMSSQKAIEGLGWRPISPSIISEIELGSYTGEPPGLGTDLEFMTRQPGNMGGVLYKAIRDNVLHRFVNVASWDSMTSFEAAASRMANRIKSGDTGRQGKWEKLGIRMNPAIYVVQRKF